METVLAECHFKDFFPSEKSWSCAGIPAASGVTAVAGIIAVFCVIAVAGVTVVAASLRLQTSFQLPRLNCCCNHFALQAPCFCRHPWSLCCLCYYCQPCCYRAFAALGTPEFLLLHLSLLLGFGLIFWFGPQWLLKVQKTSLLAVWEANKKQLMFMLFLDI